MHSHAELQEIALGALETLALIFARHELPVQFSQPRQCLQGTRPSVGSSSGGKALDVARYDAVSDFGDTELVIAGLHENFHAARYLDTHMARTAAVLEHLAQADALGARAGRRSDYSLLKFAPAHALSIRAIVAGPSRCAVGFSLLLPSGRLAC